MTTIAQVRQVVKPLLERHADLALLGRYLLIKPVHHFTRASSLIAEAIQTCSLHRPASP